MCGFKGSCIAHEQDFGTMALVLVAFVPAGQQSLGSRSKLFQSSGLAYALNPKPLLNERGFSEIRIPLGDRGAVGL